MFKVLLAASSIAFAGMTMTAAHAQGMLEEVKERGVLRCAAHNGSLPGFAEITDDGDWTGFDIDMCRTFATAIFGTDEGHIEFIPISWAQRWPLLQSGELDVVIKQSGWTQSRDTELGFDLSRPYYIGTFQVLTRKDLGAASIADLDGGTICVPAGSTNERYIANYIETNDLDIQVIAYEKWEEMLSAYYENRCDGVFSSVASMSVARMNAPTPDDHILLPDVLALEAQSWIVREGDPRWADIPNWILSALWLAEQEGITSENVDEIRADPPNPVVEKLLGVTPGVGERLGLSDDWAYNVIKQHGNYAEIWERNIGMESEFKLERGLNALWNDGGLHYSLGFD